MLDILSDFKNKIIFTIRPQTGQLLYQNKGAVVIQRFHWSLIMEWKIRHNNHYHYKPTGVALIMIFMNHCWNRNIFFTISISNLFWFYVVSYREVMIVINSHCEILLKYIFDAGRQYGLLVVLEKNKTKILKLKLF